MAGGAAGGLACGFVIAEGLVCQNGLLARMAGGAITGAAEGFAGGAAAGFVSGGLESGSLTGAFQGAALGGMIGLGAGAGLGALLQGICFVAGTQVVVGVEVADSECGRRVIRSGTVDSADAEGGVATTVRIVRYITQAIETLRQGQNVLCRDQHDPDGPLVFRPIEQCFIRRADHLQVVSLRDAAGREQTLLTTDEHPFYVLGRGYGALTS